MYLCAKVQIMAIKIRDECMNCGACEPGCPNTAIYEGGMEWRFGEGTELKGEIVSTSGHETNAEKPQEPVSFDYYFIATDKCTECIGFHETPQCAEVCPVDCCVPDEENVESNSSLKKKKSFLHAE